MSRDAPSAIVFAYHDVGVRCLRVLLDAGVRVPLVVTHADAPGETIWFQSVERLAREQGLPVATPADPHDAALLQRAAQARPDFLFSFYYRHMLRREWLALAGRGAFNMHGSLLPRYRGRVPVNWAVIHGERETGATLHRMNEKPDNGAIVDQCAVPILGDDTASEVFAKVTVAAEIVLARSLPRLIDGTAVEQPQDPAQGAYFGGRRPEDGRIPADATAAQIHNLVRALAPPYPGAFVDLAGRRVFIERSSLRHDHLPWPRGTLRLCADQGRIWLVAADGAAVLVMACRVDSQLLTADGFELLFGASTASAST